MLSKMSFQFAEKLQPENYVVRIVDYLHKPYPREKVLSAPYVVSDFNRDQIAGALSCLSVDQCRVTVSSQEPLNGFIYDQKEQWYGTQYTITPLPKSLLEVSLLANSGDPFSSLFE